MIHIGLTGWGDHPSLAQPNSTAKDKLLDYTAHFPVVELDASFYAMQSKRNVDKWIRETPEQFQFIVKAYKGITGHERGESPFSSKESMFEAFIQSILPFKEAGKLSMVLVQFPPWFSCVKENVEAIRYIRKQLHMFDLAIEFRHQSWYAPQFQEKTFNFLKELQFIQTVCDEPQAGQGSIPLVPMATNSEKVLFRLHGRNVYGWKNTFGDRQLWRSVRYLYDYNAEELQEFETIVHQLANESKNVFVIFNNNSGKHAAKNAQAFQRQLQITYDNLAAKQLSFFEEE